MVQTIKKVEFWNFRNYERFCLVPNKKMTVIIGKNAKGKTNIVEGIQFLTTGESFRNPSTEEVIRWGSSKAKVSFIVCENKREYEESILFEKNKDIFLNGNRKRVADIKGKMPAVLFTPDDLFIVKGSAEKRRAAIDEIGSQLSESYYRLKKDYEKVVKQRNSLLKEVVFDEKILLSWTESLVDLGIRFYRHRLNLFSLVRERFIQIHDALQTGEEVDLLYLPSWSSFKKEGEEDEEGMRRGLLHKSEEERRRGITLIGPHRDEIVFLINGRDARSYASQGQQRTLILAWKLAEVEVIRAIKGYPPVLLLDDVMSELDEHRRLSLLSYVNENVQTIITTTNKGYFSKEMLKMATLIEL